MRWSLLLIIVTAAAGRGQQTVTREVDLASYGDQRAMASDWELTGAAWTPQEGTLVGDSSATRAFASYVAVPIAAPIEVTAVLTVTARSNPESWVTTGISVFLDSGSFWQLALVEGPDGRRYAELVEMAGGTWQAQREGETQLEQVQFDGQFEAWEYGRSYRLSLRLDAREVRGEVADAATGEVRSTLRYAWGDAPGVKEGRPALVTSGFRTVFERLSVTLPAELLAATGQAGAIALLDDPSGGQDGQTIGAVRRALQEAGWKVVPVTFAQLVGLRDPTVGALVITNSQAFPPAARDNLQRFLGRGGDLVLLGGLPFREPLWSSRGRWLTGTELAAAAAETPDSVTLFDFEQDGATGWTRVTNHPESGSAVSTEPGPHGQAVKFEVRELKGWDNLQTPFPAADAGDANAVSLWLRAGVDTPRVAIELGEADGSRWIATIDASPRWRRYVIPDWQFEYWRDSRSEGRGGAGDYVKLTQATYLNIGLAFSHTGNLPGDHTIWFDQVGLAPVDLPRISQEAPLELPVFNDYDIYRFQGGQAIAAPGQRVLTRRVKLPIHGRSWSAIGHTFPNESAYQSLLDAVDEHGRTLGSAMGMVVNYRGRYRDSVWLLSGVEDQAFYRSQVFLEQLVTSLKAASGPSLPDQRRAELLKPVPDLALITPPPHQGMIRKSDDGQHLVYPDGRRFFMIGCNYVGHFNRCGGRMWLDAFYDPRVVEQDFKNARDAGLNVMRYWLQSSIDQDLRNGDLRKVTAIRECARKYGVYLLLDLPGTGYATEEAMTASHKAIAQAFADEPMVLGYDLRNEPYVTTLGGVRYQGEPVPIQSRDLRRDYPGRIDDAQLKAWIAERPYWLHLPGWLQGDEAERVAAAWTLWGQFTRETQLSSSTLVGLGADVPAKGWETLLDAVNTSLDRWLKVQLKAIREVDRNHLITVGHNTALTILPANDQLDFVSEHIYGRPYSHANVVENMTTLDRLAARWPGKPLTLGEFGYSNGIKLQDGYLDAQVSAVGEVAHFLYALANGYDGAMKWMLCDWPLPIMKRYGDWDRGLETRIYEERFGLYSYDGTPGGRPKPIVWALRFLRDYVEQAPPGGTLDVYPADTSIGAGYIYQGPGALFVGDSRYAGEALAFETTSPRNVLLRWTSDSIWIMACADTSIRVRPGAFVDGLADDWTTLALLAGEPIRLPRP